MSGLTLHYQKIPDWFGQFVDRCQGRLEYIVGVDVFPSVAGIKVLGRTYLPDGESNALVDRGAAGADEWINRFAPVYAASPHVHKWIGPNEYVLWDQARVDRFNAFHVRFIQRMSGLGHGVVCGQINTGWPRLRLFNDLPPYPEALAPTLAALWAHGGLFSLHEYGPGDMRIGVGAHCLRYRNTRAALLAAGVVNLPDFIITETGIDIPDPTAPQGHWGWTHFTDWPGYFDQLKWYSGEMDKDPYMRGASIFTVADDWLTFQINRDQALPLADWIAQDTPAPPPPPPDRARGIDVSQWQGDINWQAVADSGIEFAFIRATVGLRVDPYFAANWTGAGDAGILRGVYHYLEHDSTGQARHFVNTVGERDPELGYWGDLEQAELTADKCQAFLEAADRNLAEVGQVDWCNIYTRASFFDGLGMPALAPGRYLWVADWRDVAEPQLPQGFTFWEFWQTTSDGAVPGIVGRVDLDVYAGTPAELQAAYGNEEEEETYMDVKVFDAAGVERDWAWVQATYGNVEIRQPTDEQLVDAKGVFRITELREVEGSLDLNCYVQGVDQDDQVAFYWPGAPALEQYDPPTARWEDQALVANIVLGKATLLMGGQSDYNPETQQGAYGIWPLKPWMASEYIKGLGWLMATHYRHLDITFELVETDDPEPVNGDLAAMVEQLKRIADAAEAFVGWMTRP